MLRIAHHPVAEFLPSFGPMIDFRARPVIPCRCRNSGRWHVGRPARRPYCRNSCRPSTDPHTPCASQAFAETSSEAGATPTRLSITSSRYTPVPRRSPGIITAAPSIPRQFALPSASQIQPAACHPESSDRTCVTLLFYQYTPPCARQSPPEFQHISANVVRFCRRTPGTIEPFP